MKEKMQEHTKEKVLLYEAYLTNYLAVMCSQKHWNTIYIWEPFAGEGKLANDEKGSALCAAEIIDKFRRDYPEKNIQLFLNELNPTKHLNLTSSMKNYREFVNVHNDEAKKFLDEVNNFLSSQTKNTHNLLFIDPYGYTQYTRENLTSLLKLSKVDHLIFTPTNHIYRFHNVDNNPARKFVLDLGIDKAILGDIKNVDSLAGELITKLKKVACTDFGYVYKLVNKDATNSIFHLFFITRHVKGAEKFLEAKNKIKNQSQETQLELFDVDDVRRKEDVRTLLQRRLNNIELHKEAIKKGHLPKEINPILKEMEEDNEIQVHAAFNRRRGSFYLGNKDKTIHIEKIK